MNKTEQNYDTNIDEQIYMPTMAKWPRLVLISILLFGLGLIFNFPLRSYIKAAVSSALKLSKSCQIQSKDIQTSFFFTSVTILKPTIPSRCFRGPEISFDKISLSFRGPSFVPLGLRFKIDFKINQNELPIYFVTTFNKIRVQIDEDKINLGNIINSLKLPKYINGNISVNANIDLKKGQISNGDFKVKSKDFSIPSQIISGINIPTLKINNILVKVSVINNKLLRVPEIILGDKKSPIISRINGDIVLSPRFISKSKLKLKGNVKFSQKFLTDFSFLKLLLGQRKNKNGFYPFLINGTLFGPKTKFE